MTSVPLILQIQLHSQCILQGDFANVALIVLHNSKTTKHPVTRISRIKLVAI